MRQLSTRPASRLAHERGRCWVRLNAVASTGAKKKRQSTDGTRQRQRARHAKAASAKADARRERQEGAAGWVADRAGEWSLDGPDWDFFESQKYFWNPLIDYWFRMEMEGWERLPEPPCLLVGVHASGILPIDAYAFGFAWFRKFGFDRIARGTAHDFLTSSPVVGDLM